MNNNIPPLFQHAYQLVPVAKAWIAEKGRCVDYFLAQAFFEVDKMEQKNIVNYDDKNNLEIVLTTKVLDKLNVDWFHDFGEFLSPRLMDLHNYDEWNNQNNLRIAARNALFDMVTDFVTTDDDIDDFENSELRDFSGCYQNQRFENIFQLHDLVCS
ncbi:hypothetical protein ACFBZI_11725 [Moraxella sp. ZJ142]|uniref:hypothetical protein n=1 Tax=Moraxella marmotae TaxID=3344520 RepID=UPI0035D405C3